MLHEENWGMKKLAYPIQKKTTGFYQIFEFAAEEGSEIVDKLELAYRRDEQVLRYLTLKLDKHAMVYNERRRNGAFKKAKVEPTPEVAKAKVSVEDLESSVLFDRKCISLRDAILNKSGIIAEFKRQSPSKGVINGVSNLKFMNGGTFKYLDEDIYITRSGYTGEDGFEISIKNKNTEIFVEKLINEGAKLIGLGARDTLRLEAGLCLYGHELGIETTPIEASLKWAISKERLNNGGFIGSDKIINQIRDGAKKIRVGIKPEGRLIAREKTKIYNESEEMIGEVTSGTFGPSVNGPIAMGFVDQIFSKKDTRILLEVRGKKYPANICGLPFYKKSYVKGAN